MQFKKLIKQIKQSIQVHINKFKKYKTQYNEPYKKHTKVQVNIHTNTLNFG